MKMFRERCERTHILLTIVIPLKKEREAAETSDEL